MGLAMIRQAFKRLWNDKRGNALVLVGACLPLIFGSAGLATDTVQWALAKRQLQRAADSAAMAGVYALVDGKSHQTAVTNDLATNDHTGITPTKTVSQPTVTGFTNPVKVSLTIAHPLPFSSMFMTTVPTITANATAAISKEGSYCVVALSNTTSPSIVINGSITVNMGCGIISNSTSPTQAISVSGNSHVVNATPIAAVGVVPSVNGTNVELSYQLKQSDPYAGKYSTDIPALTCRTLAQQVTAAATTTNGYKVINPGCYKRQGGGSSATNSAFSTSNEKIALNPGTYYIDSADFDIGANSDIIVNSPDTTQGVTIILTGTTPGGVKVGSNAEVKLRAPGTGAYSKMLFIQKSGATSGSLISGNANSAFDGKFYFPSTTVDYNGGGASTFQCAMIVGYIVNISGNSSIQNNISGCSNTGQESIDRVRLVA